MCVVVFICFIIFVFTVKHFVTLLVCEKCYINKVYLLTYLVGNVFCILKMQKILF